MLLDFTYFKPKSINWPASPCRRQSEMNCWWSARHARLSRSSVWQLSSFRYVRRRRWSGRTACSESSSTRSGERRTFRKLWRERRWDRMNKEEKKSSLLSFRSSPNKQRIDFVSLCSIISWVLGDMKRKTGSRRQSKTICELLHKQLCIYLSYCVDNRFWLRMHR